MPEGSRVGNGDLGAVQEGPEPSGDGEENGAALEASAPLGHVRPAKRRAARRAKIEPPYEPPANVRSADAAPILGGDFDPLEPERSLGTVGSLSGRVGPRAHSDFETGIAMALGEQSATIVGAMDRWFVHLLSRLDMRGPSLLPTDFETGESVGSRPLASHVGGRRKEVGSPVAQFRPGESWAGWGCHQGAALLPGGVMETRQNGGTPGVVGPSVAIEGGRLLRVTISARPNATPEGPTLFARLVDGRNSRISIDVPLIGSLVEFLFYLPRRARGLKMYVLVKDPVDGFRCSIEEVAIEALDGDAHFAARSHGQPVMASLATIPERVEMLEDCVLSLLPQCDRVRVFLNGYPDIPAFLDHPRIEVRRSQSFDDRGDAGKFAWIDAADPPGYRIVVDDDLIFPPDFADQMVRASDRYRRKAIVGLHGILLKQPIRKYYDAGSRHAFHFASALKEDRTVHVLGTNAICFHSEVVSMRRCDFMWPNMADIFLARHAQRTGIPMIAIARPANWVLQNEASKAVATIYDHSSKGMGTRFDTSWIQDLLIKACEPLTIRPSGRPKVAVLLFPANEAQFERDYKNWREAAPSHIDWVLLVVPGSDADALGEWLRSWTTDLETHIFDDNDKCFSKRFDDAIALSRDIEVAAVALLFGEVRFRRSEWIDSALSLVGARPLSSVLARRAGNAAARNRIDALVFLSHERCKTLAPLAFRSGSLSAALERWIGDLGEIVSVEGGEAELSLRALGERVGFDDAGLPRLELVARADWRSAPAPAFVSPSLRINGFFSEVFVINLDRRPDRWEAASRRLAAAGIRATRIAAVDGAAEDVLAEYRLYLEQPPIEAPDARIVDSSKQFYMDYDSQAARAAYAERLAQGKAIQSAGAWAYLKTWKAILERALRERRPNILVFDDDVMFHKQAPALFAAAVGGLPPDWLVLQLGSLQYDWEPPWVRWRNRVLYSTNGAAVGSHAVGVALEAIPYLLDQVGRMQMPFDIGALSATVRGFRERCFVVYPNIAIQELADSDIRTSTFQRGREIEIVAETYRWRLEDYDFFGPARAKAATQAGRGRKWRVSRPVE